MPTENISFDLRSYGRRKGRKASPRQAALLRDVLPKVAVDLTSPPPQGGGEPLFLEIGFGGGEHLIWQARANPNATLIGCEPFEDGVVKVLGAIEQQMGDARDVLRWLPEASIARAFVLFPDPWPKRKQQKRRLVNPQTLTLLALVMKPGAELRFGTDIGDYARSALEAFAHEPRFKWLAERPTDWRVRPGDWPETRYEQKAGREGRRCYYFRFVRS
jgi:tRNA (guanine-N7-)-methyltransferase